MHISTVDLNLVPVLHALLEERSVSRAARRLGLSQSATSHALARLRQLVGDALFVRTRDGLVPTARAEGMHASLSTAMGMLETSLLAPPELDPRTLRRTFHVGTSDYAEHVLLRPLLAHLEKVAPHVNLWVRPVLSDGALALARGELDVLLQPRTTTGAAGLHVIPLWEDTFVGVMRRGHPLARRPMTLSAFTSASHAFIAPGGRSGGAVDDALAKLGLARRIAFTSTSFLVPPPIVAESDLLITLAARIAAAFAATLPLVLFEPPVRLEGFRVALFWHDRHDGDPAHRVLRDAIVHVAKALPPPRRPPVRRAGRARAAG